MGAAPQGPSDNGGGLERALTWINYFAGWLNRCARRDFQHKFIACNENILNTVLLVNSLNRFDLSRSGSTLPIPGPPLTREPSTFVCLSGFQEQGGSECVILQLPDARRR
jgi:hypothetical protein